MEAHKFAAPVDLYEVASPTDDATRAAVNPTAPDAITQAETLLGAQTRAKRWQLDRAIIEIDRLLCRQLDEILHHPRFQRLEASWRNLRYLVDTEAEYDEQLSVKVKMLNVTWPELAKDVTRALEFDQSHLFRRIYSDEFDMPGGEPFGVLLADYEISHRPRPGVAASDLEVMREVGRIGNAALCPSIFNASAPLFGVDEFAELPQPIDLQPTFVQREYIRWRSLRLEDSARFIGLVLPRVLTRKPYRDDGTRREQFTYREDVSRSRQHYLWGGACYAFGSVLIRAFANTGWFADIRGGVHAYGEGGVARHLQHAAFDIDRRAVAVRSATDLQVDDFAEREFADAGFIPLCSRHSAGHSAFYSNSSLHQPAMDLSPAAAADAKLSAMIQYMLCVSRFGHYIKVIARDKIGSFIRAEECQRILQNWLNQYTTSNEGASSELKARYPLAASRVEVNEMPGRPGHFSCVVHLQPHFQLDQLVTSIRLVTELAVGSITAPT